MILLTGASGFIGKYLFNELLNLYSENNVIAFTSKIPPRGRYLNHRNYNFEKDYFLKNKLGDIDVLIHAGAFIPKMQEESNNIEKAFSNIVNTKKLIFADLPNLKKIIFLSTIDVYSQEEIITEETVTQPMSMYGYSKLYCEKMIEYYSIQNNLVHQILRIGHVYGPGEESYKKLIPELMRRIIKGENIIQYGTGEEYRSYIFIDDVIKAIVKAVKINNSLGPINIVTDKKTTVKELIDKIVKISGKKIDIKIMRSQNQPRNLIFDNGKMKKVLTIPKVSLDTGLAIEYDYFLSKIK